MTDNTILRRAKEGNAEAIAALMNHSLNSKGIHATAERAGDRLLVNLETDSVPDQALLTKFVHQGVKNLNVDAIETVMVTGRIRGGDRPAWTSTIRLGADSKSVSAPSSPAAGPPPPPPPPSFERTQSKTRSAQQKNTFVPPPPPPPSRSPAPSTILQDTGTNTPATEIPEIPSADIQESLTTDDQKETDEQKELNNGLENTASSTNDVTIDEVMPSTSPLYDYDVYASDQFLTDDEESVTSEVDSSVASDINNDYQIEAGSEPDLLISDEAGAALLTESHAESSTELGDQDTSSVSESQSRIPPSSGVSSEPQSSSNPVLLGAVFLVVVGAVGSLAGYSLWSYFSAGGSLLDPGIVPPPVVTPQNETDNVPDGEASDETATEPTVNAEELLQEAADLASSASNLSQTAQSGDDWNLIVDRWQRAINLIAPIPESDGQYATAQQRLATYRSSLALAQQQASARATVADTPLPSTVISTEAETVDCLSVAASANSPTVELTNVRFDTAENTDTTRRIVGCITNHGEQAIASATIDYSGLSTDTPDSSVDGRAELQFAGLEPSNTVAFQGDVNLPQNLNSIEISTLTWSFVDSDTPQSIDLSLALTAD
jgi:hypothetical protein